MLLKSLSLENVRSYKKLDIEFPSGYVLFEGDVGSGKSTILMAIEFALFGLGSLRPDGLLSAKEQRCEVRLQFQVNGTKYEIGRVINRKDGRCMQDSAASYLSSGGIREPLAPTDLKAKVLEILNFREPPNPRAVSRVYRYAVYTPQEEIKSILGGGKDREETVRKAFGMEDYKVAIENARATAAHLTGIMEKLSWEFSRLGEYESDLDRASLEADDLRQDLEGLHAERADLEKKEIRADSELSSLRDQMNELIRLQAKKDQMEGEMANQKTNLERLRNGLNSDKSEIKKIDIHIEEYRRIARPTAKTKNDINAMLKATEDLSSRIRTKKSQLDGHRAEIQTLSDRLDGKNASEIRGIIAGLDDEIKSGDEMLHDAKEELLAETGREGEKSNEIKTLTQNLQKASSLGTRCEYCDSELGPGYVEKLQRDRRARLDIARTELATTRQKKRQAGARVEKVQDETERKRRLKTELQTDAEAADRLSDLTREANQLEAELSTLEKADSIVPEDSLPIFPGETTRDYLHRLLDALSEYEHAVTNEASLRDRRADLERKIYENEAEHERCMKRVRTLEDEANTISQRLVDRDTVDQNIRTLKDGREEIREAIKKTREDISEKKAQLDRLEDDIKELQITINEARERQSRHKLYGDHVEWLTKYFIPSLYEVERNVMDSLRSDFNDFYSRWYKVLVEDPTKESYIDDRFGPVLEQDGYDQSIDHISGGEKTSVALAYRLALNSTMRRQTDTLKSNLLILDEPTDGFSKAQLGKVRIILESLRSEQVIMVSHEEELEGYVDHIFRVEKNGGVSTIQKVE